MEGTGRVGSCLGEPRRRTLELETKQGSDPLYKENFNVKKDTYVSDRVAEIPQNPEHHLEMETTEEVTGWVPSSGS